MREETGRTGQTTAGGQPAEGKGGMTDRKLLEGEILLEQVKQLYSLAPIALIATVMNSLIVFVVMRDVSPHPALVWWWTAIAIVTGLRLWLVVAFKRSVPDISTAPRWKRWFLATLAAAGCAWGSIGLFPFSSSIAHEVFLAFVLGGMAAGASSTFTQVKSGYAAFSVPALTPLAVHFLLMGEKFYYAMGAMTFLYIVLLARISRHNYRVNRTSLLLRFENQDMIESLRSAKESVEELNTRLVEEIEAKQEAEKDLRAYHGHLEKLVQERTSELVEANEQLRTENEERKTVEAALRESRERLLLAQRAGRVGIFDWKIAPESAQWKVELEQVLGVRPGEFPGEEDGWPRRVHPEDLAALEEKFRSWTGERAIDVDFEYRVVCPAGEPRWMAVNGRIAYRDDGAPWRLLGTKLDVTEMKQSQERLVAAKEAAEAGNLAKTEFLANMSHEMRTPLAGVLGMIKLVLDMEIGDEERKLLEMARRSADSLLRIIADVLDFSRLEAGMMKFEEKPFSLVEVIRAATEVVSLGASERGLQVSWSAEADIPQRLFGDAGRVRQVLVNLLGNAVKFTEKGEVEVTAARFPDPESGKEFVLLSVRDTGVGIPQEQLERIFGKFTQVDSSLTKKYGGTGLGLALSKQIVEKMGGRIWGESRLGAGSTFHFTIPIV